MNMMNAICLFLFGISILTVTQAHAEKHIALVIGNSTYAHAGSLRNPANDAEDVADALKSLGFEVTLKRDLTASGFASTISNFFVRLAGADVALFWYAGHRLQYQKDSYLMPVDAQLENEFAVRMETIRVLVSWGFAIYNRQLMWHGCLLLNCAEIY